MVSKTQKKKTLNVCKYVYLQGKNKGKKCGRNCRGLSCRLHKQSTVDKKLKYYNKTKVLKTDQKTKEIIEKIKEGKITEEAKYRLKLGKVNNNLQYYWKKLKGIHIALGKSSEEEVVNKYDKIINARFYKDADDYVKECYQNNKYSEKELQQKKDDYIERFRYFMSPVYIPYNGSASIHIEKIESSLNLKISNAQNKIKQLKEIVKAFEENKK